MALGAAFGGLGARLDGVIDTVSGQLTIYSLQRGEGFLPLSHSGPDHAPASHPSRTTEGVVAIELVLILPFLLMLLVGVLVLGIFLSVKGQASNCARDGARQLRCSCPRLSPRHDPRLRASGRHAGESRGPHPSR